MSGVERHSNLDALRAAGFPVDSIAQEQRHVLDSLTAGEVSVLIAVQERLQEAVPEVQAHSAEPIIGGVLF